MEKSLTADEVYKIANPRIKPRFISVDVEATYDNVANKLKSRLREEKAAEVRFRKEEANRKYRRKLDEELGLVKTKEELINKVDNLTGMYVDNSRDLVTYLHDFVNAKHLAIDSMKRVTQMITDNLGTIGDILPKTNSAKKLTSGAIDKLKKRIYYGIPLYNPDNPMFAPLKVLRDSIDKLLNNYSPLQLVEYRRKPDGTFMTTDKKHYILEELYEGEVIFTQEAAEELSKAPTALEDYIIDFHNKYGILRSIVERFTELEGVDREEIRDEINEIENKMSEIERDSFEITKELQRDLEKEKSAPARIKKSNSLLENFHTKSVRAITFENIRNYDSVEELLDGDDMILIIYRYANTNGHWVCLFKNSFGYNYFNSSGSYVDKTIDVIPDQFKEISKQNYPYLLYLLSEAHLPVHYNEKRLQSTAKNVNTCGRWCGYAMLRCAGNDGMAMERFVDDFLSVNLSDKTPSDGGNQLDELIVLLTDPFLKTESTVEVNWV